MHLPPGSILAKELKAEGRCPTVKHSNKLRAETSLLAMTIQSGINIRMRIYNCRTKSTQTWSMISYPCYARSHVYGGWLRTQFDLELGSSIARKCEI
jgi:hypothetical protein